MPLFAVLVVCGLGMIACSVVMGQVLANLPASVDTGRRSDHRWRRLTVALYRNQAQEEIARQVRVAKWSGLTVGVLFVLTGLIVWID